MLHSLCQAPNGDAVRGFRMQKQGDLSVDLWKIAIHTSSEAADAVEVILAEASSLATAVEDRQEVEYKKRHLSYGEMLDERQLDLPVEGAIVSGYFEANPEDERQLPDLLEQLQRELTRIADAGLAPGPLTIQTERLREDDYLHAWKKDFHVIEVSPRLAIVPAWEKSEWLGRADQLPLYVEPGVAFGTGTHETTLLCLRELERVIATGTSVLDIGTGTGILAIAAAKLGANRVLAVDLDETAVRVARENVLDNEVADVVTVQTSDLDAAAGPEKFAVVTANLLADLVKRLAPSVKHHLQPGGCMIASGIVQTQWEGVRVVLEEQGFSIERVSVLSDWLAVCARWGG